MNSLLNTMASVEITAEVIEFPLPSIYRDFGQVCGGKIISANNFQSKDLIEGRQYNKKRGKESETTNSNSKLLLGRFVNKES